MLIRAFLWGNDLKAFLLLKSAIFAFPHECHKKPTTATTTWNSKQKLKSAIFCFFSHSFSEKFVLWLSFIPIFFVPLHPVLNRAVIPRAGFRVCLRGGAAYYGGQCGLSTLSVYYGVGGASAHVGAALNFILICNFSLLQLQIKGSQALPHGRTYTKQNS